MAQVTDRSQKAPIKPPSTLSTRIITNPEIVFNNFLFPEVLILWVLKENPNGKGRKWKLWRTDSMKGDSQVGHLGRPLSEASDSSLFTAAVATVVRARTRDFMAVRREWAAIRIQTMFRVFLVTGLLCKFFSVTLNLSDKLHSVPLSFA